MARPAILCKLKKGKMIDAQEGFVDTFNWMVDYINNLKGDDTNIEVKNPTGTNPVIELIDDASGGGGSFDVKCVDSEGNTTTTTVDGTLTFQGADDTNISFVAEQGGIIKVDVKYK